MKCRGWESNPHVACATQEVKRPFRLLQAVGLMTCLRHHPSNSGFGPGPAEGPPVYTPSFTN